MSYVLHINIYILQVTSSKSCSPSHCKFIFFLYKTLEIYILSLRITTLICVTLTALTAWTLTALYNKRENKKGNDWNHYGFPINKTHNYLS